MEQMEQHNVQYLADSFERYQRWLAEQIIKVFAPPVSPHERDHVAGFIPLPPVRDGKPIAFKAEPPRPVFPAVAMRTRADWKFR